MTYEIIDRSKTAFFQHEGYLKLDEILTSAELSYYDDIYNQFLNNTIETGKYRSDLSGSNDESVEKITQIMLPSQLLPELLLKPVHKRVSTVVKKLMGDDMTLDFDMLINKAPHTNTITPWHQDEAYWVDLPDKRAISCWVAIDESHKNNGAMWYTPKSHTSGIFPHLQIGEKGALQCDGSEQLSVCMELTPGDCVFHHGATLHYSRGNATSDNRRAFILNFRPKKMIALERSLGVDHSGERIVRNNS